MTEQTRRLKKALEGCAERGISPTPQPWAEIESRLEASTVAPARRPRRFLPKTRAGLALAAALVVLFGMGAYAASGLVYKQFRFELPGASGPVYGEQLDLSQTANGVRVSLEWAYADSENVVVGYNIEDLEGNRQVAGRPAELGAQAVMEDGAVKQSLNARLPESVGLTDESGIEFDSTDGQSMTSGNLQPLMDVPVSAVFTPEKSIEPGDDHRFLLKVPVIAQAIPTMNQSEPVGEPFVFDFEIPVRPAPTIEPNREVEAAGVPLILKRVTNSPARPEAEICYGSPDTRYDWSLYGETDSNGIPGFGGGPMIGQNRACTTMLLPESLEGRSTVTVERLEGFPDCPPGDDDGCTIPQSRVRTIHGPWTFEFTVPEG